MKKLFALQFKRVIRILPLVLAVVLILFCALTLVFHGVAEMLSDDTEQSKFQIAIVGQTGDSYLEMGITALQSFDTSRFAVDILRMNEEQAAKALRQGSIGAYVVIPEGFVEEALHGRVMTLKYVSTVGAAGLVSMFKDEITTVISEIVIACQRGMYGIEGTLEEAGHSTDIGTFMNEVSVSYVEYVLIRSKTYKVESIGIHDELGMEGYLFSGISVLFLSLCVLPFGCLYIKQDLSFGRILKSKGRRVFTQLLSEFLAFFVGCLTLLLLTLGIISVGLKLFAIDTQKLFGQISFLGVGKIIPAIFMICAFGYLMFQFSGNIISGMLLGFFSGLVGCFAGGCMYPIYFFPSSVQQILSKLPHSIAREQVSVSLLGHSSELNTLLLLFYGVSFLGIGAVVRQRRIYATER